ncbi:methyltransferase-like protein 22 [Bombus vosnesenskii]|uniref:Methyltransferase-like protein 22 n=2 Tax=Pyrobombus TaxID=144703 RepID=A0A6J3KUL6_9HYME|nr:methyltransferase-like protein 22 [Bombus vancouverensis nearcticus]XP_033195711.1 methyltransferase-like protein 22 [Bombus vancouverensis nearcticus]XP_033195712.1 methyltransferase-like protein 22 [Bombus vancouverensis nearcticus]XP_033195713.1 methyltransferase-like protein 22 [Bombus vancouverensis nearcticus]XP_033356679.1 methyltransferase-like protein 22 [Bombus vosnesenskii]XP_033356680.1 methyltransferase-like protein 22 [Bombus vosnesenskii]XP_033356681.1 methyltransferase-like
MTLYTVTSEIFTENKNSYIKCKNDNVISSFIFKYPSYMIKPECLNDLTRDNDDDINIDRQQEGKLLIEHHISTELQYVGLQVWRGALLLADYILSNPDLFRDKVVLELGAGVGLTSIVASFLAKEVICTDIDVKGILKLIHRNFMRNKAYIKSKVDIKGLDFLNLKWPTFYKKRIDEPAIILAADVIYDETVTKGFVQTLTELLNSNVQKVVYITLEKRYVFTTANMETTAPMYEEFLDLVKVKQFNWHVEYIKIDFPQYFKYNRLEQMVLIKIKNKLSK